MTKMTYDRMNEIQTVIGDRLNQAYKLAGISQPRKLSSPLTDEEYAEMQKVFSKLIENNRQEIDELKGLGKNYGRNKNGQIATDPIKRYKALNGVTRVARETNALGKTNVIVNLTNTHVYVSADASVEEFEDIVETDITQHEHRIARFGQSCKILDELHGATE